MQQTEKVDLNKTIICDFIIQRTLTTKIVSHIIKSKPKSTFYFKYNAHQVEIVSQYKYDNNYCMVI